MQTLYVIAPKGSEVADPSTDAERAAALGAQPVNGLDVAGVTVWPSAVVTSTAQAPTVIADDAGQATLAEVQAAQQAAATAEQNAASAITTARSGISTLLASKDAWATQIQTDAATIAALTPGSTLTQEVIDILGRILTVGLANTMQAHIDHLTVNGITS